MYVKYYFQNSVECWAGPAGTAYQKHGTTSICKKNGSGAPLANDVYEIRNP